MFAYIKLILYIIIYLGNHASLLYITYQNRIDMAAYVVSWLYHVNKAIENGLYI